ncbi:hypothetical protein AB1Y20_023054 [Prymnesium parvum]|uniref:Alpha-ketoglutarate-dependent dioxygenase AlkB-like domain-containing protein n=1 Tax=Prymnesium parvum TaxID=97485 RepID=A0AB34JCR2_PRYPA
MATRGVRRLCQAAVGRRKFARRDSERLRHTSNGAFVLPADNPGIRVEPNFVTEDEEAVLTQVCEESAALYGYAYDGDTRTHTLTKEGVIETSSNLVNNLRVTGRLERADLSQRLPPWGYGEMFSESSLPPPFFGLASRVRHVCPYLGPLRDVTINGREKGFFQLDPHVDPEADGPDVFILSLLSSVVVTFTPTVEVLDRMGLQRRTLPQDIGLRSWSDADIDVLAQPRTLLHFRGAARNTWMHAIRAGVAIPTLEGEVPCDWWGQTDYLLRRSDRRFSIVLAFGKQLASS